MPGWMTIPLASKHGTTKSKHTSLERLTNLYPQPNPDGSVHPFTLLGTPGLKSWTTVGDGPIRGMRYLQPYLYVVSGQELYAIDSAKIQHNLGEIKGNGNVYMTANRTHVGIATSKHLYAANKADGITDLPEQYMSGATYQDGYGVFPRKNTEQFYATGVDDMTSISALDFSSADRIEDNLVTCISHNGELWLLGQKSVEVWGLVGASFPFARTAGGSLAIGCKAPGSVANQAGPLFWLGHDGLVYTASGYSPASLAPPWVAEEIDKAESPESAWAFCYSQKGHSFYVLGFSDRTLCYDLTTGAWHLRKSQGISRWRANVHAWAFSLNLVGDYDTSDIYELDPDTYDDNGAEIRAEMRLPPVAAPSEERLVMAELRLLMQSGVGLDGSVQGSAPLVMLDWSDDDGHRWSNELTESVGAIGEYEHGVAFTRLGAFRHRTLRISISDPVKREFQGLSARLEPL